MTSTYHAIVADANHAARLIDQGMLSTAAKELSRVLSLNKKILVGLNGDHSPPPVDSSTICATTPTTATTIANNESAAGSSYYMPLPNPEHPNRLKPSASFLQQVFLASDTSAWCRQEGEQGEHDVCGDFVYRNIMFIPTDRQYHESPLQLHVDISLVIMFNLSLCHHLAGMNKVAGTAFSRRKALQKACSFYNILQNFLTKDQQALGTRMFLLLASVNNLGQVLNILGDTTAGKTCFLWILSTLVLLTSVHWDQRNHVASSFLAQLHKNTSYLVLNSPHTAQAA